jgi:hypothetical protein
VKTLAPTGLVLVGVAFLLCCLIAQACLAQCSNCTALEKVQDFHQKFKDPGPSADKTWSELPPPLPSFPAFAKMDSQDESGVPQQGVVAISNKKQRDLVFDDRIGPTDSRLNSMNIDVSRITVIAMNMVEGGNAVATSNIILNPVQSQGISSSQEEVEERLV